MSTDSISKNCVKASNSKLHNTHYSTHYAQLSLPKIIVVTGTPGTGKTYLSKKMAYKKGYLYFDVIHFIRKKGLSEGYDRRRKAMVVHAGKLSNAIIRALYGVCAKGVVIDSHLSHYLPAGLVSKCIVTKCSLKVLKRRLMRRGYNEAKINENMQAEIFDICLAEASDMGHRIRVVWTG